MIVDPKKGFPEITTLTHKRASVGEKKKFSTHA